MNAATMRRPVAALLTAMLAVCLSLALPPAVADAAVRIDPDAATRIEIHKLEQPDSLGGQATGLPQDISGLAPVGGATFTAQRVPGVDLTSKQGQLDAGTLTIAEAAAKTAGQAIAATGTTDAHGNTVLAPLEVGLYYVQETHTPAGYVSAAPFLVALPLTHPAEQDTWLHTVHVYPKNAKTSISLEVVDQDAMSLGDTVHWTSTSSIPNVASLDGYQVHQVIDTHLDVTGHLDAVTVSLTTSDGPELKAGVDYTLNYATDQRTLVIDFLPAGLQKLTTVIDQNPHVQVRISYGTVVLAEGHHTNRAVLYPSRDAIDADRGVQDEAVTKWGPISVIVHENNTPDNPIPGARFRLYRTAADAAAQRNPITINGVQEWETDAQGRVVIHGLRFSNFVNGLDRDMNDPLYRLYWFAPSHVPEAWRWVDATAQAGAVNHELDYQTLTFLVDNETGQPPAQTPSDPAQTEPPVDGTPAEPGLSATGAQTIGAVLLAAVLLVAGFMLVRRRRTLIEEDAQ